MSLNKNRHGIVDVINSLSPFFYYHRNKHIMVDLGTGNNNKINWALADKQEMIDIIEVRLSIISILNSHMTLS